VWAKSNEITVIPNLPDTLTINGHIDEMGKQRKIVKKIRKKRADYVLALKGNQDSLHDEEDLCFDDSDLLSKYDYYKTVEKARVDIEKCEYCQTDDNNLAV